QGVYAGSGLRHGRAVPGATHPPATRRGSGTRRRPHDYLKIESPPDLPGPALRAVGGRLAVLVDVHPGRGAVGHRRAEHPPDQLPAVCRGPLAVLVRHARPGPRQREPAREVVAAVVGFAVAVENADVRRRPGAEVFHVTAYRLRVRHLVEGGVELADLRLEVGLLARQ